jgi:hypothetical protein
MVTHARARGAHLRKCLIYSSAQLACVRSPGRLPSCTSEIPTADSTAEGSQPVAAATTGPTRRS